MVKFLDYEVSLYLKHQAHLVPSRPRGCRIPLIDLGWEVRLTSSNESPMAQSAGAVEYTECISAES